MNQVSPRDVEQVSAYLDGQLSRSDSARLESRLRSDPKLRSVYEGLRQSQAVLRKLPQRRAPRNFRLTPQMAGIKPPLPRVFPFFRLASALAAVLFFLGYGLNLSAPLAASMAAATSFPYAASAPAVETAPAPAPTEAPEETFAPKFAPSQAAGLAPQDSSAATATPAETMSLAISATEMTSQTDVGNPDRYVNTLPAPQPATLPVHPAWLFGFLGLAVVSGASAFLVRVRTERSWSKANAAAPVRLGGRDLLLMALVALVVLLLAAAVYWMSTGFSALIPGTLGADAGNAPVTVAQEIQEIPFTSGTDYIFSTVDSQGLIISIDFPADALKETTTLYYIPVLDRVAPEHMTYFADHAFTVMHALSLESVLLQAPMTIRVDYDENVASVADENKLALYWWSGSQWLDAAATCAPASIYSRLPESNQISLPVCQFGTFLLVAP